MKKQTFTKDYKNWQTVVLICCFICLMILLIGDGFTNANILYLILYLCLILSYCKKYTITEEHTLTGNGVVRIEYIEKIVYEPHRVLWGFLHSPNWVTLYYLDTKTGRTIVKRYYPRNAVAFIQTLKGINPHIQVI